MWPREAPPEEKPSAPVALNDASGSVVVDADGRWSGWPTQSPAIDEGVRRVLASQKIEIPAEALALPGVRSNLRGGAPDGRSSFLVRPVGVVVEEDRPRLRWRPVARAKGYVVVVSSEDGGTIVKSPPVTATEWTLPQPLTRGQSYLWQVTASTPEGAITAPRPPEPEAHFRVLDARAFDVLRQARRTASQSHLVMGILDAQAGLLDDAERELIALADLNPAAALPRVLLADIRRQRDPKAAPTTENAVP
jgi:hypothetical protein